MKTFNGFKMLLIAPIVFMNINSIQGKDFAETLADEVFSKTFILGIGWIALSGSAFVGKKIFNNLSEKHPLKKEHYLKMAKLSRNVSLFSAIPLASVMLGLMAGEVCRPLVDKYPTDSFTHRVLDVTPRILLTPAGVMTFLPAVLSSGLMKHSNDPHIIQDDNKSS
jgi:hypothetical protein